MNIGVLAPAISCASWAAALSWRAREGSLAAAGRGLAGGLVAFAAALGGYAILERAGLQVSWTELLAGGGESVVVAAAIGLVEESAKLLGLALASLGTRAMDADAVVRRVLLVSAAFASFECAFTLGQAEAPVILVRAVFAPVAHAALAIPLGMALVGGGRGLRWIAPALILAAVLHGASDLALAVPALGRVGYAAILSAPAVALHLHARLTWMRRRPA